MADFSLGAVVGVPVVVPVIGEWTAFTPTFGAGLGTVASQAFFYRRVGSGMEVKGAFTAGTVAGTVASVSLPSGTTLASSALPILANIGAMTRSGANASKTTAMLALTGTSTSLIYFGGLSGATDAGLSASNGNQICATGESLSVHFTAPILEWAGSATVAYGAGAASVTVSGLVTTGTQSFAGNKTFTGTVQGPAGAATAASFQVGAAGTGLYSPSANSLGFAANGLGYGSIASTGAWTLGGTTAQHNINGGGSANNALAINMQTSGDSALRGIVIQKVDNVSTTSQKFILFQIGAGAANNGGITANGANTAAFEVISDERLKENITNLPSQLESLLALRPVEFDYKSIEGVCAPGHEVGFIAQEMEKVFPESVATAPDTGYKSIVGWSKTEARLVKAIQEQQTMIVELTARLTKLEGA